MTPSVMTKAKPALLTALVACALCLCLFVPAGARAATGSIAGFVVDANGKAVSHASVTIQTSYGGQPHATFTDANGHFAFDRFRTGQYDLRAYAHGLFSEWTKRVPIRTGKTANVRLQLSSPIKR
jgi:Carboxypeptidase regulatory-like domain